MRPGHALCPADVNGRAAHFAEQDVALADAELALRVAHGGRPVAAAARLVEQHRTVLGGQFRDQFKCRRGGGDPFYLIRHPGELLFSSFDLASFRLAAASSGHVEDDAPFDLALVHAIEDGVDVLDLRGLDRCPDFALRCEIYGFL